MLLQTHKSGVSILPIENLIALLVPYVKGSTVISHQIRVAPTNWHQLFPLAIWATKIQQLLSRTNSMWCGGLSFWTTYITPYNWNVLENLKMYWSILQKCCVVTFKFKISQNIEKKKLSRIWATQENWLGMYQSELLLLLDKWSPEGGNRRPPIPWAFFSILWITL